MKNDSLEAVSGGISGQPLLKKSNKIIEIIKEEIGDQVKIIGVGGIISKESAISKLDSGADLLQMYTGLVYKGTNLIKEITASMK